MIKHPFFWKVARPGGLWRLYSDAKRQYDQTSHQAFIEIVEENTTPNCTWFNEKKWKFDTDPSDKDLPPEIKNLQTSE